MTGLVWDQVGTRRYEAGCDRGVLYLSDGTGVPWNGLTSVEDDLSDITVEQMYLDGVKYLNRRSLTDYNGTLKAITYPDEFEQFDGNIEFSDGFFVTAQPVRGTFSLSYRTLLGTDVDPLGTGYRIHLLYNLTAQPDNRAYSSLTNSPTPAEFSWKLTGIPVALPGMRPTAHFYIDSTRLPESAIGVLETYLYGNDLNDPTLPDPSVLVRLYDGSPDVSLDFLSEFITEPL